MLLCAEVITFVSKTTRRADFLGGSRKIGYFQLHVVDEIRIDFIGAFVGGQDIQSFRICSSRAMSCRLNVERSLRKYSATCCKFPPPSVKNKAINTRILLQWVEADTLKLVERIAQDPERKPLLFLGAYRDNKVDAGHRLMISCEMIKKSGQPLQTIPLKSLNPENISQLLAHTCHCRPEEAKSLAELLVRKTGGNPFFLGQFLTLLSEKELIRYSPEEKRWTWKLAAIEFLAVTENVVDLLVDRLHWFSSETRKLLSLAACIGNIFDL